MRRILTACVLALATIGARAQEPAPPQNRILLDISPRVRDSLSQVWDDKNPAQVERAYCVFARAGTVTIQGSKAAVIVVADSISTPDSIADATPSSIRVLCPALTITLHTHPPTTCNAEDKECVLGGSDAFECFPSIDDWDALTATEDDAGIIQCDRNAFVVFVNPTYLRRLFP